MVAPPPSARPFDPADTDGRLWIGIPVEPPVAPVLSAEAQLDSTIHAWNSSGLRVGPFRLGLKDCDSFLTCQLDFHPGSELDERFGRMREIEGQAALSDLYRRRLEAMRIRRNRKPPN